jgi:hypothetical protein
MARLHVESVIRILRKLRIRLRTSTATFFDLVWVDDVFHDYFSFQSYLLWPGIEVGSLIFQLGTSNC